jgi:hypothetical protein
VLPFRLRAVLNFRVKRLEILKKQTINYCLLLLYFEIFFCYFCTFVTGGKLCFLIFLEDLNFLCFVCYVILYVFHPLSNFLCNYSKIFTGTSCCFVEQGAINPPQLTILCKFGQQFSTCVHYWMFIFRETNNENYPINWASTPHDVGILFRRLPWRKFV